MERLGRHIRQLTSSRDVIEGEAHRINETCDNPNKLIIKIDVAGQCDDDKLFSELVLTQVFSGLYVTYLAIGSIFKAIWLFITFILVPVFEDYVLPIIVELFKKLGIISKSVKKHAGKEIEKTKDHYHNNTTNWL